MLVEMHAHTFGHSPCSSLDPIALVRREVNTDIGHVLVYGADRSIGEKMNNEELRKIRPQAALV